MSSVYFNAFSMAQKYWVAPLTTGVVEKLTIAGRQH
jgi:hypothetical protein